MICAICRELRTASETLNVGLCGKCTAHVIGFAVARYLGAADDFETDDLFSFLRWAGVEGKPWECPEMSGK